MPDAQPQPPRATYRLQLTQAQDFRAAAARAPYLARLGVSHCYFSPYLKTRPGSQHGYDVVDHTKLNPELGGEEGFAELCAALERHGLKQVLDIVPNHIGIMGSESHWWLDVLENGRASRFAEYFDIDWQPVTPELKNKVLVPVLGDQYGNVLLAGELDLTFDAGEGELSVFYFDHRLPLDPATYPHLLQPGMGEPAARAGERTDFIELESVIRSLQSLPSHGSASAAEREVRAHEMLVAKRRLVELCRRSPAVAEHVARNVAAYTGEPGNRESWIPLHRLLEAQPYRPAYWRVAADEINYRRFFDINDLAGLRTQNEDVLEATHRRVLDWVAQGKIHGLRIDHPDGLYDPRGYLRWLSAKLEAAGRPHTYVVVEKILAAHEYLPSDWPVNGTTGYDFSSAVNGLFVFAPAEREIERVYRAFTQEQDDYETLLYRCKRRIILFHLSSELTVLAGLLNRIADSRLETRDFTLNAIRAALLELVAAFPVYRSYATDGTMDDQDRRHIEWAISSARQGYEAWDDGIFDFIRKLLLGELADDSDAAYRRDVGSFVGKFQQLTAPVMAKALEDTCFYRYVRLLSLNEVGGDPRRFGITTTAFHRLNHLRLQHWPHSMLGTSTHDSKRSEDVRARINVISENPAQWRDRLNRWRRLNRAKRKTLVSRSVPSRNEEYLLYQTLAGCWPAADREGQVPELVERVAAYMEKALREAKVNTAWSHPKPEYEALAIGFARDVLSTQSRNPFLEDLDDYVATLAVPGFLNSVCQTLLKLTSPGVPDIYQGNELWDFSLVDPDNRRPVDFARRESALTELIAACADPSRLPSLVAGLARNIGDGKLKLYVTWRALHLRARLPLVFGQGAYLPLDTIGERAEHVCAFARRHEHATVVVAVGRWFTRLAPAARGGPQTRFDWGDTAIAWPGPGRYKNVLTGEQLDVTGAPGNASSDADGQAAAPAPSVAAETLFRDLPLALLAAEA